MTKTVRQMVSPDVYDSCRIERIELEETLVSIANSPQNLELQRNKLKHSHPYDKAYLQYFWSEILDTIYREGYRKLIFIGAGAGNEAAYIRSKLGADARVVVTDLSHGWLKESAMVFYNYSSPLPDGLVSCSFNNLPFSTKVNDYCAVAFLCLHHSASIEQALDEIMRVFDQAIIFEPVRIPLNKVLSRLGITQRKEGVDYKPARVDLSTMGGKSVDFKVECKTYLQIPRDFLPFISHEQQRIYCEDHLDNNEIALSDLYFRAQKRMNQLLRPFKVGNMALLHLKKRK